MNVYRTTQRIAWTVTFLSIAAATATAQFAPAGAPGAGMPPGGVMPAAYGGYAMPAGGGGPMFMDPAASYGYGGGACDAYGNPIGGYGGGAGYGAGAGWDQCGPHYYDFSGDFLYWTRDRAAEPQVNFMSQGVSGPIVLAAQDLEMDDEPGFRATARLDLGPLSFVEGTYFGTFFWEDSAQAVGNGDLFSVFSDFGTGVTFLETDFADLATIRLESELHSSEINWRRYWVGRHPAITGTILMGARWVHLTEEFQFSTVVNAEPAFMDYVVDAKNDLVGFQTGGDVAVCLRQGIRAVASGKVGIYNNRVRQTTQIVSTTIPNGLVEQAKDNTVAFVGEGEVSVVADILPSFSVRAGYQVLFLNSVALGANNFNSDPPFGAAGASRVPFVEHEGKALYHGLFGGVEYIW